MAILFIFLMGIGNFALHSAVMAADHPLMAQARGAGMFGRFGRQVFFALEFLVLLGSLAFAAAGSGVAIFAYGGYTALNAVGGWMMLTGRV